MEKQYLSKGVIITVIKSTLSGLLHVVVCCSCFSGKELRKVAKRLGIVWGKKSNIIWWTGTWCVFLLEMGVWDWRLGIFNQVLLRK